MKQVRVISWISREVTAAVLAGIVVVLVFLAVVIFVPELAFVGPDGGLTAAERAKVQSDFRGHLIQALGGLVLAAGAVYTARTFALNREGQITERFTRAVEQLADEKLDIRLGGIYALGRIARDSETHYEPAVEVLTAFLRRHTYEPPLPTIGSESDAGDMWPAERPRVRPELGADIKAAAAVLGQRDRRHERRDYRLDLRRVALEGASLEHADFEGANMIGADLYEAKLAGAHLSGANLRRTIIYAGDLRTANLAGADLAGADLRAGLAGANLSGADLTGANLSGTWLSEANLSRANLFCATLSGANFWNSTVSGADFSEADLSGADLSEVDLSDAIGLTHEQLVEAGTYERAKLPEYLSREAGE